MTNADLASTTGLTDLDQIAHRPERLATPDDTLSAARRDAVSLGEMRIALDRIHAAIVRRV